MFCTVLHTLQSPQNPMWTAHTFTFDLLCFPVIAAGAFLGRWLLPRIDQRLFESAVLLLAGVAAVQLIIRH